MAIDLGDAILTFRGDTTELDQTLAKVDTTVPTSMGAAKKSIEGTSDAVDDLATHFVVGQQGAVKLGDVMNLAGDTSRESMYQARGEMQLIDELIGIRLPRHVVSFIAELPGVGAALSAAFTATAVLFIIDAVIKVAEKIVELVNAGEELQNAWDKMDVASRHLFERLDDDLLKAQQRAAELTGNHLEALRIKLQLIDNQSLSKLDKELETLGQEADKVFEKLDRNWFSKLFLGEGGDEAQKKLHEIGKEVDAALSTRTPEAFDKALVIVNKGLDESYAKLVKLDEQQKKEQARPIPDPYGLLGPRVDPLELASLQLIVDKLVEKKKAIEEVQATEKQDQENARIEDQIKATKRLQEIEAARQKGLDHRLTVEARYAKDQEKQHEKAIKDAEREKEEEVAATNAVANNQLQQFRRMEEGAVAFIDGEIKLRELQTQRDAELLASQYQRRQITADQYLAKLKTLYQQEVAGVVALINQKEQLFIAEAQKEAAARGQILSMAQAKELKAFIDLENQKALIQAQADNKFLKAQDQVVTKIAKEYQTITKLLDDYVKHLRAAEKDLQGFGKVANSVLGDISNAFGSAIESWLSGQESFGKALEKALAQYLIQVAGKAAIDALYFAAWGIADSFWNPPRAGADFAAAAEFAAIAGVAGAAGAALGNAAKGGGGAGGDHPNVDANNPNNQPAQNPQQGGRNIPHLAGGGLIVSPTLAMIGDSSSGGSAREGILPLDDDQAMRTITAAIADRIGHHGGNFYLQPKGMVSADTLGKLAKKLSRQVQTGRARLIASNSHKVTRRA